MEGLPKMKPLDRKGIENCYASAFGLYDIGNYEEAAGLFTFLALQDPFDARFWKGLASSRQMNREYQAALPAWANYCLLSREDPMGHFHAGECFLSMGEKNQALKAFQLAEVDLKEGPIWEKIQLLKGGAHG